MSSYVALEYQGGPILTSPELVSLFWGWFSRSEIASMQSWLQSFASYLSGAGAPTGKAPTVQQYGTIGATIGMTHIEPWSGFLMQTGTPLALNDAKNFAWAVGDFDQDGIGDLYAIKVTNTGTGSVEVHVLSGADNFQSFLMQTGTPLALTDAKNFAWAVGDFDQDGIGDLYAIKVTNTGTGSVEVHVLIGADNFQSFLLQTGPPLALTDAKNFAWAVGDFDQDGIGDLYAIKVTNTGTGSVEAHVLSGADNF